MEALSFLADGELGQVHVTLGQQVAQGQVLATLDTTALTRQIQDLEEAITHAQNLGYYSDRVAQAEIDILKVELAKMQAEGASGQDCHLKELDIEEKELELTHRQQLRYLDIRQDKETLEALRSRLESKDILAPFAGRVVYVTPTQPGSSVRAYEPVLCLADDHRLTLQTDYISEAKITGASRVYAKLGQQDYDVSYIPCDAADYIAKTLAGETVYTHFTVQAPEGALESGQFGVLMVYSALKENVLTVPINAIYKDGSIRYVYKLTDGQRVRCNVELGLVTATEAEVLEGLRAGDIVYVKN